MMFYKLLAILIVFYPTSNSYAGKRMVPGSFALLELDMPGNIYVKCWIKGKPGIKFTDNTRLNIPDKLTMRSFGHQCLVKRKRGADNRKITK